MVHKYLQNYVLGSAGLSGVSKVLETWNAKVERYNDVKTSTIVQTDMLLGEKIGLFVFATISGPYLFPFKALGILNRIDIYNKGHDPLSYGYREKNNMSDYLF